MNEKTSLKIDLRIICMLLIVIIVSMIVLWRPWEGNNNERKITTTGQAEVEATPDVFVFSPRFERSGADTAKSKDELDAFGAQLQTKLKELGVKEEDITLDSSSYDYGVMKPESAGEPTVSLAVTIEVPNQELAQKVQDYLATTDAKGQLTAMRQFSDTKQRELENQARDKAVQDARTKADRTAKDLNASLGNVIEIKDTARFGGMPIARDGVGSTESTTNLPVTPGKNSVTFSVDVVFELR